MAKLEREYEQWRKDNNQFNNFSYNRFIMTKFLEGLDVVAPGKYIFKGGNLLWHYIKTPRPTVDLDFSTDIEMSSKDVLADIAAINVPEIKFSVRKVNEIHTEMKVGMAAQIDFTTEAGGSNSFGIDIVFASSTHQSYVKVLNRELKAASIENIVLDKVAACQRFGSGNTRMKDFDDLYRISQSRDVKIRKEILVMLAAQRNIQIDIDPSWGRSLASTWDSYLMKKNYKDAKDLPRDMSEVVTIIREFLGDVTNVAKHR